MPFKNHTIEDWINQVKKEIPIDKSLEQLKVKSLFYENSGFPYNDKQPKDYGIYSNGFQAVADIINCNAEETKSILNYGPEVILLDGSNFPSFIDFNFIMPIFDFGDFNLANAESIINNLQSSYDESVFSKMIFIGDNKSSKLYIKKYIDTSNLVNVFKEITKDIDAGVKCFYIQYIGGINLTDNITTLRALRILLENVKVALGSSDVAYYIAAYPSEDILQNIDDTTLIKLNYFSISSILGAADFIHLIPFAKDINKARIAHNMINVFKYESMLDSYNDPVNGSYYFEDVTEQIVKKVWSELSESHENIS